MGKLQELLTKCDGSASPTSEDLAQALEEIGLLELAAAARKSQSTQIIIADRDYWLNIHTVDNESTSLNIGICLHRF
jgi:hypothetical protein